MSPAAIAVAQLVAQYGVPLAEKLWREIAAACKDGTDPSQEMWDNLRAMTDNTIEKRLAQPAA